MSNIFLYHYADKQFEELQTLKYRGETKEGYTHKPSPEKGRGAYDEHISFFIEPIPLKIMGRIFGRDHHTWFPGNEIFEHKVSLNSVCPFTYHFVETPEKTLMLYDDSIQDDEYYKRLNEYNKKLGYVGASVKEFEKPYRALQGCTEEYYKLLPKRPNWKDIRDKYAATVPHVMLYPVCGKCPIVSVKQCVVGDHPY